MAHAGKGYRQVDDFDEDDGLSAMGRKNARHAEELHDEVVRTCETIVRFLTDQFAATHPDDWREACVTAAFDMCHDRDFYAFLPRHYDLTSYDTRALAIVLEYNLPILEFRRGARVSPGEIHAFVHNRNLYEHRSLQLNGCRWRSDLESVRFFRSKMQTDEEIAEEAYSVDDLPQMEEDSAQYLARLDSLQHQIEAITNTVLGMGDRLAYNAKVDEDQFAELDRQHDTDEEHDRSIGELGDRLDANARVDIEQAAELRRQNETDSSHDHMIAEMADRVSELSGRVAYLERDVSYCSRRVDTLADQLERRTRGVVGAVVGTAIASMAAAIVARRRR